MAPDGKGSGEGFKRSDRSKGDSKSLSSADQCILQSTIRERVAKRVMDSHPEIERSGSSRPGEGRVNGGNFDPDTDETTLRLPGAATARRYRDILRQALIDSDPSHHREVIEKLHAENLPIQTASIHLFAPVAAQLGEMWCDDDMDFIQVAVASSRLNVIVNHLVRLNQKKLPKLTNGRSIILARTLGDNHTLGLTIVSACFADEGWIVDGGPDMVADDTLMQQLSNRSYALMGLSIGASFEAEECRNILTRGHQNSRNRQLRTAIGGPAVAMNESAFSSVGADIIAQSALHAVEKANALFAA